MAKLGRVEKTVVKAQIFSRAFTRPRVTIKISWPPKTPLPFREGSLVRRGMLFDQFLRGRGHSIRCEAKFFEQNLT